MKLYNPFKPHIVQFQDGTYGVRRLSRIILWGWEHCGLDDGHWWSFAGWMYCKGTLEQARERLTKRSGMESLRNATVIEQ